MEFIEGITFDDVLLSPAKCSIEYENIELITNVTKKIKIKIPILSAPWIQ